MLPINYLYTVIAVVHWYLAQAQFNGHGDLMAAIGVGSTVVSPEMQQATVNLFADMGVQPGTLQTGLIPATKSTDVTPPVTAIFSPGNSSSKPAGAAITISGTASDAGGGVVAGVEISTDGGVTWRQAEINAADAKYYLELHLDSPNMREHQQ